MGKKIFINKKYKDKTKKYKIVITKNNRESRTKLNRNNIRAETYSVCDQSSMLIEIPLLELELPPLAAA